MSLLEQDSAHHADRARKPPASNPNPLWAPFGNRPKTNNNSRGQDRRTDMRFSPTPTHVFEHESRTQA